MRVVFVHGWSVTDTNTYGLLPEALSDRAASHGLEIDIQHVWLGRYISFHDDVSMADIARALDRALRDQIPDESGGIAEFSCITHSTGGPVVREWLDRFYGAGGLKSSPLRHLVMLAPANHGSALAALGKQRVGRIKAWFAGVEPGQRILDWLTLGSRPQIDLARAYLEYKPARDKLFPFVLTGQAIDKKMYDFLNGYLVEAGSDGVVRVAGANLNYTMIKLVETRQKRDVPHGPEKMTIYKLKVSGRLRRPAPVALGVVRGASHSGEKMGIMRSITSSNASSKPQVGEILECLKVRNAAQYRARSSELQTMTESVQKEKQRRQRFTMLVFSVVDDQGEAIEDFDLFLLGRERSPDKLSKGFFVDRQKNAASRSLVYYVDYDVISKNQLTGFRVIARPSEGFAFYHAVEYHSDGVSINDLIHPNETFYVEIVLHRCVDENVFRLDPATQPKLHTERRGLLRRKTETRHDFSKLEPSPKEID